MSFENQLQGKFFGGQPEKTFIDKILAKEDIKDIRALIKKPKLTREDLLELLYLLSGSEAKLLNFSQWDRYVQLKFFVWIREFIKIAELLFDYKDDLNKKENTCKTCEKLIKGTKDSIKCKCVNPSPILQLTPRAKQLLYNNERLIEHNAKFLIDLYFNIGRTTLSVGATGIMELLKNKYEVIYPVGVPGQQAPQPSKNSGTQIFKK